MKYAKDELVPQHITLNQDNRMNKFDSIEQCLAYHYGFDQEQVSLSPLGNGHINTTRLIKDDQKKLVVQKINTDVFPEPIKLVENARSIESHLQCQAERGDYPLELIKHVKTQEGAFFLEYEGDFWRALEFIGGSYSEDVVSSENLAFEAAKAFGLFAASLNDFEAKRLYPVIPRFHDLSMRYEQFDMAVAQDNKSRLTLCQHEVDFVLSQRPLTVELSEVLNSVPLRVCHNDTKINNMLFCTQAHKARAVIDLDTCMPGAWLFDFGDMVRTFCSPEAEDSKVLENVKVRPAIFEALAKGYITPLNAHLNLVERKSFILGAKVMPLMIGIRFLTDYLNGDTYFATRYPEHNLDRAKNQFKLYQDVLKNEALLEEIILSI